MKVCSLLFFVFVHELRCVLQRYQSAVLCQIFLGTVETIMPKPQQQQRNITPALCTSALAAFLTKTRPRARHKTPENGTEEPGGFTGGYAIPHFRNFSALFPQIRRQKLAISAILSGYEQSLSTLYKAQHKPFSFYFARDRREKFCCCCCCCGCCLQIFVICIAFVCFSAFKQMLHNILTE